jgi:hypothetical protein
MHGNALGYSCIQSKSLSDLDPNAGGWFDF